MSTTKKTDIINSLLDLPEFEPETSAVKLPRLGIVLELRELPYDKLVRLSREQDAQIHLILSCVTNHPELKQAEWYKEKMKCATPADGLKRLLRKGEVEKICRTIDLLHGYSVGSVVPLPADQLMGAAIHAAVEGLEKLGAAKGQADRAAQISGDACHPRRDKHRIRQIRCAADRRTGTSGDGGCIPHVVPMAVGDKNHVRVHLLCPFRTASPGEEGVRQDFVDAVIQQKAGMAQKLQLHICSTPFSKMGRTAVRASVGWFS